MKAKTLSLPTKDQAILIGIYSRLARLGRELREKEPDEIKTPGGGAPGGGAVSEHVGVHIPEPD